MICLEILVDYIIILVSIDNAMKVLFYYFYATTATSASILYSTAAVTVSL